MQNFDWRYLAAGRRQKIGERSGEDVGGLVVNEFLEQRIADALGDAAGDLTVDNHRIDEPAGVFGDNESLDADATGFRIDFDNRAVTGIRESPGGVVGGRFGNARVDIALEEVSLVVGGAGQTFDGKRAVGSGNAGDAVLNHNVFGGSFKESAGNTQQFRAHLAGRKKACAASDYQRAAGERPPAIGSAVGIAVNHFDSFRCDADLVGDNLGKRGAQSLTVRTGADPKFDETGRIHRQLDGLPT